MRAGPGSSTVQQAGPTPGAARQPRAACRVWLPAQGQAEDLQQFLQRMSQQLAATQAEHDQARTRRGGGRTVCSAPREG